MNQTIGVTTMSKLVRVSFMPVAKNGSAVKIKSKDFLMTQEAAQLLRARLHTDRTSSGQLPCLKVTP